MGSLGARLDLQKQGYEAFLIIADYQVITDRLDTKDVEKKIFELARDYLAVGVDKRRATIFVQSRVPELAELTTILSMLVSVARVERNPTVKEEVKAAGIKQMSLGMFSYPVSQAADILLFTPEVVPVGEDQLPHIELTREIASRFNRTFGEVFPLPKPVLGAQPRLLGLDASQKMSKSRGNTINLSDAKDAIFKKIKTAVTDSGSEIVYDPKNKPAISNLLVIFSSASGRSLTALEADYRGKGYAAFKLDLAEAVERFVGPIRERRAAIPDATLVTVLSDGIERARDVGAATLSQVKRAMQYHYPKLKP